MKRGYDFDRLAGTYGFNIREMEKVCRISDVLEDLSATRFLRDRLSLYGGTAIAFIYSQEILRLSTDIDLNYRHLGKKDWGEVRDEIDSRIKALLYGQGYRKEDIAISPKYPLVRFTVGYRTSQGLRDTFTIEVGYLRRYPILKEDMLADFRHMGTQETFPMKTPQREELFANKWCALLYRSTSRDLSDVYLIASMEMNSDAFRKCAVVDSLMRGTPKLHEIDIRQIISQIPLDSSLRNLLQVERVSEFDFDEMRRKVIRFSKSTMSDLTKKEVEAIDQFFEAKRFEPESIDEEGIFHERLREHPSIQWALRELKQDEFEGR